MDYGAPPLTGAFLTDRGLNPDRPVNEDACGIRAMNVAGRHVVLAFVADGMGGMELGEVASEAAGQTFLLEDPPVEVIDNHDAMADWVVHRVHVANAAVVDALRGASGGCTFTGVIAVGSLVAVAHVGDSRAYLYGNGRLAQITQDHSLVAALVKSGQLTEQEAAVSPDRNAILRSLGQQRELAPGYVDDLRHSGVFGDAHRVLELAEGEGILLCSDGIWGEVPDAYVRHVLTTSAGNPNRIVQELVDAAKANGAPDNCSAVVLERRAATTRLLAPQELPPNAALTAPAPASAPPSLPRVAAPPARSRRPLIAAGAVVAALLAAAGGYVLLGAGGGPAATSVPATTSVATSSAADTIAMVSTDTGAAVVAAGTDTTLSGCDASWPVAGGIQPAETYNLKTVVEGLERGQITDSNNSVRGGNGCTPTTFAFKCNDKNTLMQLGVPTELACSVDNSSPVSFEWSDGQFQVVVRGDLGPAATYTILADYSIQGVAVTTTTPQAPDVTVPNGAPNVSRASTKQKKSTTRATSAGRSGNVTTVSAPTPKAAVNTSTTKAPPGGSASTNQVVVTTTIQRGASAAPADTPQEEPPAVPATTTAPASGHTTTTAQPSQPGGPAPVRPDGPPVVVVNGADPGNDG